MMLLVRHLLAILLLPVLVVVVAPYGILTAWAAADTRWAGDSLLAWLPRSVGIIAGLGGLVLFGWCVCLFARIGQGTLAPWDPTRKLVAVGPYRYVRNPMISGVAMMLVGQALFSGSWMLAAWAAVFIVVNHVYFVGSEEPGLERRFGEAYRKYKANVPRWLPRRKPWRP